MFKSTMIHKKCCVLIYCVNISINKFTWLELVIKKALY